MDHPVKDKLSEALLSCNGATPPRTVLDLSGVTFMDSGGINVLIAAHKSLRGPSPTMGRRRASKGCRPNPCCTGWPPRPRSHLTVRTGADGRPGRCRSRLGDGCGTVPPSPAARQEEHAPGPTVPVPRPPATRLRRSGGPQQTRGLIDRAPAEGVERATSRRRGSHAAFNPVPAVR
ncbi:STAS domain-containing protein [Streptomyces canus]|uniref:STAS domain-containing protein n=1 Tax=Streptomyces canus TaxID=58343 RepID=UPI0033B85398